MTTTMLAGLRGASRHDREGIVNPVITLEKPRRLGVDERTATVAPDVRVAEDAPRVAEAPWNDHGQAARDAGREAVVSARGVTKRYGVGDAAVDALRGADVDLRRGEFTAIMGPSGSGKSTLMHILAGLDGPTAGTIAIDGQEIGGLKDRELTKLRRDKVGFIFQSFNLLPTLTAAENIALPLTISGRKLDGRWFEELVETVRLTDRLGHKPSELSGGQQQRVAVARALVSRPAVLFADEPTGNLDSHTGDEVLQLLRRSVDDLGQTIIMVTHDAHAAATADRVLFLQDGEIVQDRGRMTRGEIYDVMKSLEVQR
jgi:putative ABC transport system ATP-binding protein